MGDRFYCDECGEPFAVDRDSGVANHVTEDGGVDYDADADHVPYGTDPCDDAEDVRGYTDDDGLPLGTENT